MSRGCEVGQCRHNLLFHCLVNRCAIRVVHLVKLIDEADALRGKTGGPWRRVAVQENVGDSTLVQA